MTAPRLAIATCAEVPGLDDEGRFLLERFAAAGVLEAEPVVWDDPSVDWAPYSLVLLRSTWDYPRRHELFLEWCDSLGERLINSPRLVRWNSSKRYLANLEADGVPIVPTSFFSPGQPLELPDRGGFVVKPAVSAGSRDTARYDAERIDEARVHAETLLAAGREVLVQPYLESVDEVAETAVIVLAGEVSHAMRKAPLLELDQGVETGLFRPEEMSPREPAPDEVSVARWAVEAAFRRFGLPLYARVDLLRADDGSPVVLELELIEPSLFLDFHPPAAARIAELLVGVRV